MKRKVQFPWIFKRKRTLKFNKSNAVSTDLRAEVFEAVRSNAFVFLNKAIRELTDHKDKRDGPLSIPRATIVASLIQIAFELILNAYAIERIGLKSILEGRDVLLPDEDLLQLFEGEGPITKNVTQLRKELQQQHQIFSKHQLEKIESFQRLRNKLVHFRSPLLEGDRYDLKFEIVNYIVHVIVPLLRPENFDIEPIAVQEALDSKEFKKLITFPPYVDEMARLARDHSDVFECLFCGNRTLSVGAEVCFACCYDYQDQEFADCPHCDTRRSIIFDQLNIGLNHHKSRGKCLNCGMDDTIYKCPSCESTYAMSAFRSKKSLFCRAGLCVNES